MRKALAGSVVLHVLAGVGLLAFELDRRDAGDTRESALAIEIVPVARLAPPSTPVQGGGASQIRDGQGRARPSATTIASRGERRGRATERAVELARAQLADYAIERGIGDASGGGGGDARAGDGGAGDGVGGSRGSGIGFGDGGRISPSDERLALPPVPKASKARRAKLIYPTRERDLGEEALFIARVTVDTDGYVVGARLVRGRSGPRDDEAADLIFRFRYLPALDDDGHAIRSTFEQPFHVNR